MSNAADRLLGVMDARGRGVNSVSELSYGTVTSVNPLVITRDGGAALTAGFLVLSRTCKELTVQTETSGETVRVWPGLSIGEKVILLSFNSSQKFFVERM